MGFAERQEPKRLLLDTRIDSNVSFRGTSVLLPESRILGNGGNGVGGGAEKEDITRAFSISPVAGSRDWLPALVTAGRQEAMVRDSAGEGSDTSGAFLAVDLECVLHKYRRWHQCFPGIKPFYAVKCNPNREVVLALAMTSGCGFDCASPAEIDLVLGCGADPCRIIYANPCKEVAALQHALSAGITTVTFDSKEELLKIRRVLNARAQQEIVQMVLRLRVPDGHSECPLGEKYGAMEEVCGDLIAATVELGFDLVGVSFHCGSGCQNAQAYPEALEVAKRIFELAVRNGIRLTLLDIGGGFPGWDGSEYVYEGGWSEKGIASPPPLSLEEIAEVTRPCLDSLFPPSSGVQVIAEPGRYFVEASHVLFTRIYAKRSVAMRVGDKGIERKTALFISEGVNGCFKDSVLFGVCFEPCPIPFPSGRPRAVGSADEKRLPCIKDAEEEEDIVVMGPSGSSVDVVARKRLPKLLGTGDWLYFSRMGAYTSSIANVASSTAVESCCFYVASSPDDSRETKA